MASYGVQTANLFELLGDDVGDDEAPQEVATPVKPKPVVKLPKQAEKPGQQPFPSKGLVESHLLCVTSLALFVSDLFIFF